MHVGLGGQPGTDVEELADARLGRQVTHRPAQERAAGAARFLGVRHDRQRAFRGHPVDREVVLAADHEVVDPGDARSRDVDARGSRLSIGHFGTLPCGCCARPLASLVQRSSPVDS
jgi:hypothetical protein